MGADEAKLQALLEAMINIKQPQLSGPHLYPGLLSKCCEGCSKSAAWYALLADQTTFE